MVPQLGSENDCMALESREKGSVSKDSFPDFGVPFTERKPGRRQALAKVDRLASPRVDPADKHLPLLFCKADEPRVKEQESSDKEPTDVDNELKAKLGKIVDDGKYQRALDRDSEKRKRCKIRDEEEWREIREEKTLSKKYPDLPIFGDVRQHSYWLQTKFRYLERDRRAFDNPERGKDWERFCKLAGTNNLDGNIAKQVAAFGAGTQGRLFHENRSDAMNRPSGLKGTADPKDAGRTWAELHARLLCDISAPGNGARDITTYGVRQALEDLNTSCKDSTPELLLQALKKLTVADKEGAPLTKDQVAIILRKKLSAFTRPAFSKYFSENFQLVLIKALRDLEDVDSIPVFQALKKNGASEAVRRDASLALTDFGPFPKKEWSLAVPDPRLTPADRATQLTSALDSDPKGRWEPATGARTAELIASLYKMPKKLCAVQDKDDPGLKKLERALDSEHLCVRMAAAKVLAESKLDFDNPVRKKAASTLADAILDPNVGVKAKLEAIALLDDSLVSHHLAEVGKYTIAKQKNNLFGKDALVVEDNNYQYIWTERGQLERKERENKIRVGDKTATLKLGLNSITARYVDGSDVISRTGRFDQGELVEVSWKEVNKKGKVEEFVAKRVKSGGKYGKNWVITIPDQASGLTRTIPVQGTFTFTTDGAFQYVGQDWCEPDSRRIVHRSQNVKDKGVTTYHNKL